MHKAGAFARQDFAERLRVQCTQQARHVDHVAHLLHRSERLAKYNQLLRIEEELGSAAEYAGENWRFIKWESA